MSKIISEENPNPTQSSNAPQASAGSGGAQDKLRKQARQLAYDTRYKVKGQFKDGQKTDAASLKKAYMSQLGKSPAPGPVKQLAKKMLVGEEYDFINVDTLVGDTITNVFAKVFTEEDGKKYKIRVTDKETKKTYVRMATREKINQLRANPKISSVEMTGYGTPYEGERKKGEHTASVKSGKGLAKKDYDGDGKRETPTAEYKGSKDKAIKKAIAKEEFIGEVAETDNPDANVKKVDVMKGKNKIIINPTQAEAVDPATGDKASVGTPQKSQETSAEKRVRMVKRSILQKKMQAVRSGAGADIVAHTEPKGEVIKDDAQYGYDKDGKSLNPEDKEKESKKESNTPENSVTFDDGATITPVGDSREFPTIVNLIKNKLRARGLNMSHEPEGEMVDEANKGERVADRYRAGKLSARPVGKRASKKSRTTAWTTADVGQRNINRFGDGKERKLNKFGSDYRRDSESKDGLSSTSSDHAQKQRRSEHEARRGKKTKGVKEGYQRDPEQQEKERKTSKQSDPSKDNFTGISGSIATIMKQNAAMKKAAAKKVKKEEVENIDELKTSTLRSYANRASIEAVGRGVDAGVKGMTGPKKDMEKNMTKAYKRQQGINRAVNKLASRAEKAEKKEGFDPSVQSAVDALDSITAKKD